MSMQSPKSELQNKASDYWSRFNKSYSEQPAKKDFLIDRDFAGELMEFFERIANGQIIEAEKVGRI